MKLYVAKGRELQIKALGFYLEADSEGYIDIRDTDGYYIGRLVNHDGGKVQLELYTGLPSDTYQIVEEQTIKTKSL